MSVRENKYRFIGVLYLGLGIWFFIIFSLNEGVQNMVYNVSYYRRALSYGIPEVHLLIFSTVVGSVVLSLLGIILMVRGGLRVSRVSGILFGFLVVSYLVLTIADWGRNW